MHEVKCIKRIIDLGYSVVRLNASVRSDGIIDRSICNIMYPGDAGDENYPYEPPQSIFINSHSGIEVLQEGLKEYLDKIKQIQDEQKENNREDEILNEQIGKSGSELY